MLLRDLVRFVYDDDCLMYIDYDDHCFYSLDFTADLR